MQKTNIRNLFVIYSRKIIACFLFAVPLLAQGQFNVQEYEHRFAIKPYHFGITLAYNNSFFKMTYSDNFLYDDSILTAESTRGPGFNMGIISNLRLGNHFDLRFIPSLSFAEKDIEYKIINDGFAVQKLESIYFDFPFDVKFKSDAYKDMKLYAIAGVKYSYDLSSNAKARNAENIVKINANDIAIDYGFGFEFYFPYFIFCPEIKFSNGLINLHNMDPNLRYSNVLDQLFSRTLLISIHLEG